MALTKITGEGAGNLDELGIGTTSIPTGKLAVEGGIYLSGSSNFLRFGADSSTTTGVGIHRPAANTLAFVTSSAERARVTDNGITFNGDTAAANALDDYEEGTWTPVSGTITLSSSAGKYTKIGNLVSISWLIEFPSTSNSGSAIISGFPFNVAATQYSGTTAITNFGSSNILPMVNYADNTVTFRTYSNTTYTNANMSSKFHYGWAVYST